MHEAGCVRAHTRVHDAAAGMGTAPDPVSAAESLTQSLSSVKVAARPTTTVTA